MGNFLAGLFVVIILLGFVMDGLAYIHGIYGILPFLLVGGLIVLAFAWPSIKEANQKAQREREYKRQAENERLREETRANYEAWKKTPDYLQKFASRLDYEFTKSGHTHAPHELLTAMLRQVKEDQPDEDFWVHRINRFRIELLLLPKACREAHPPTSISAAVGSLSSTTDFPHVHIPYPIPDKTRFSHAWIVAPPDAGKTTALENLIVDDLPKVARGEASIFVLDSQNEMIPRIAKMKAFAPGGPLHGKLVLLEPDPEYPLALNIFDLGDNALPMITFILEGLLQVGTTPKQAAMFRYIVTALMSIPDATLRDFKLLLSDGGYARYRHHIERIDDEDVVEFFQNRFDDRSFKETKNELMWRLDAAASHQLFRRMFSHPRNKLNLFEELGAGKVVLVNANKDVLKGSREPFGRFFIALLLQVAEHRMSVSADKRLPVFAYIDEASDYIREEGNIAELLDKARKQKIAMTLAHQRVTQITNSNVQDALANSAIILAGRNKTDAPTLARIMRTEPEHIMDQPQGSFSAYVTGMTKTAITVSFPPSPLNHATWMTHEEEREIKRQMRERYCEPVQRQPRPEAEPSPSKPTEPEGPIIDGDYKVVQPRKQLPPAINSDYQDWPE